MCCGHQEKVYKRLSKPGAQGKEIEFKVKLFLDGVNHGIHFE